VNIHSAPATGIEWITHEPNNMRRTNFSFMQETLHILSLFIHVHLNNTWHYLTLNIILTNRSSATKITVNTLA
jgi:hypothetical protein